VGSPVELSLPSLDDASVSAVELPSVDSLEVSTVLVTSPLVCVPVGAVVSALLSTEV
jgi:hypothetical protein